MYSLIYVISKGKRLHILYYYILEKQLLNYGYLTFFFVNLAILFVFNVCKLLNHPSGTRSS